MALALTLLATQADTTAGPCCDPGKCTYRRGRVHFILKRADEARAASPFPVELREVIRDVLVEWEGETALVERSGKQNRCGDDRAHDMALDILMACATLRCRPTRASAGRIAAYLCPWSDEDDH